MDINDISFRPVKIITPEMLVGHEDLIKNMDMIGPYFILDENHQMHTSNWVDSHNWFVEHFERLGRVASTEIGEYIVSTVFLKQYDIRGQFETIVFKDGKPQDTLRAQSWDEALDDHARAVAAYTE